VSPGGGLRLRLVLAGGALLLFVLLLRAGYLAVFRHAALAAQARDQQTSIGPIAPVRGAILDRSGRTLACSIENPSLALRADSTVSLRPLANDLVRLGICTPEQGRDLGASRSRGFVWLSRRWVGDAAVGALRQSHPEVELVPEMKRFYPAGPIASRVLGLVGTDGRGLSGLEWVNESWLAGEPGQALRFVTGMGRPQETMAPLTLRDPRPGGGLLLTLDARVDEVVRCRLREGMAQIGASEGFAVVLDPWTGEILALCGEPDIDPLSRETPPMERLKVSAVTEQYEPGSVFKLVTFAAALESGRVSLTDPINCMNGRRAIAGITIHDVHGMGVVTADEVLIHSSNIGTGLIAERVGWEWIYRTAQSLGFGQPTGIELGGEAAGDVPHPLAPGWWAGSLPTLAYGQQVAVTGLQMALAYAAVANGGLLMKPLLVRARLDPGGQVVERMEPQIVRRAISAQTATTLAGLLRRVVTEGTGRGAEVKEFPPAGKTGTAQLMDPLTRTYAPNEYNLSFIGFAPFENARCLIAITMRCHGQLTAGQAVAPVFGGMVRDLVWLLEEGAWDSQPMTVAQDPPVIVPDVRGMDAQLARQVIHGVGLLPVLEGMGNRVERLLPPPYAATERGGVVHLALVESGPDSAIGVPDVARLSLRRAVCLLAQAGLKVGPHGSGWVVRQEPEAGSQVDPKTLCEVWAEPDSSRARQESLRRNELTGGSGTVAWAASP
jgi:cell division protein FtsI (penicillin-binding protein 3)